MPQRAAPMPVVGGGRKVCRHRGGWGGMCQAELGMGCDPRCLGGSSPWELEVLDANPGPATLGQFIHLHGPLL